jgi:hypothetical protein
MIKILKEGYVGVINKKVKDKRLLWYLHVNKSHMSGGATTGTEIVLNMDKNKIKGCFQCNDTV